MVASGAANEEAALKFFSEHFGVPMADLSAYNPDKEFLKKFPVRILIRHRLIPLSIENGTATAFVTPLSVSRPLRIYLPSPAGCAPLAMYCAVGNCAGLK